MEKGHSYIFDLYSPAYAEGYDRIFGKKVKDAETQNNENRGRRSVPKTDRKTTQAGRTKPKGARRRNRTPEVR